MAGRESTRMENVCSSKWAACCRCMLKLGLRLTLTVDDDCDAVCRYLRCNRRP